MTDHLVLTRAILRPARNGHMIGGGRKDDDIARQRFYRLRILSIQHVLVATTKLDFYGVAHETPLTGLHLFDCLVIDGCNSRLRRESSLECREHNHFPAIDLSCGLVGLRSTREYPLRKIRIELGWISGR